MSDSTVIDKFVGEYESDGVITPSSPADDKKPYYPKKGVKLVLDKLRIEDDKGNPDREGKAYAKIRIKPDGAPFGPKVALERAVFRVHEGKLIADNIELAPGSLLTETLEMTENSNGKKEMKHTLNFSDGGLGTWVCIKH
jgi:hypothetical protein